MIAQHLDRLDSGLARLTRELLGDREDLYTLRVAQDRPDSLLAQGDLIIIRPCEQVPDGATGVLYRMDDGQAHVMLRRVYRENGEYRLEPLNPDSPAAYADPDEVTIQAKLLLTIRSTASE